MSFSNRLSYRKVLLSAALCLSFTYLLSGSQSSADQFEHVVVRKPDSGRAFGWPANGGIWNWGDEILVMYLDCPYVDNPGFSNHDSDQTHPSAKYVTSRSLDGGKTWTEHRDAFPWIRSNPDRVRPTKLTAPIDFSDPNTILTFHWDGLDAGDRKYFYVSRNRGRDWQGPFNNLGLLGFIAITGRTDYEVTGPRSLTAYFSVTETEKDDCYRGSTYAFTTDDGGLTWQRGPRTSRQLSECGAPFRGRDDLPLFSKTEYAHMPSTVRLDDKTLVSAFRSGDYTGGEKFWTYGFRNRDGWVDITRSLDNGRTWRLINPQIMELPTLNSTPPALSVLPFGRLVCSWGYRLPDDGSGPTGIEAKVSDDRGETWSDTITLRRDGFDYDIGYNRQVVRADGKLVTVYYYRTQSDGQIPTYIAATIWDADKISP